MKKIFFLFVPILLLAVSGCNDNVNSPDSKYSNSYFPLFTGNEWTFLDSPSETYTSKVKISGSFTAENQKYYLLNLFENSIADTITSENNVIYILKNNVKEQWINFNSKNNETYNYDNAVVTVNTNLTVTTKLGEFKNCISFNFDVPAIADDEVTYYFSKGIGLVKINYSGGRPFVLKDYKLY